MANLQEQNNTLVEQEEQGTFFWNAKVYKCKGLCSFELKGREWFDRTGWKFGEDDVTVADD